MQKIDIIVPCYNEEESLNHFYEVVNKIVTKIQNYEFTFLFVNDGSTDRTLELMKQIAAQDELVKFISFSRNFGKEAAMYAGLQLSEGNYVVIMDADLQDDPQQLKIMVQAMEEGYDCCATRRIDRRGEPRIRSWFANKFYRLMNQFTDVELVDGARDYRMMTRQMVDAVLQVKERERFSKGIFAWVGFRYKWLEFENREREFGITKWSFWSLARYAMGGIIAFSTAPLKLMMAMGGMISIGSIIFMFAKIIKTLVMGIDVPGYASIVVLISFLGGMNLFAIGLVGIYIGNVYSEVKKRPIYIIKETNTQVDIRNLE